MLGIHGPLINKMVQVNVMPPQTNKHTHRDTTHARARTNIQVIQTYNTARCMYRQQSLPQNHHTNRTSSRVEVIRKAMKDTDEHIHLKEGMRNYICKMPQHMKLE